MAMPSPATFIGTQEPSGGLPIRLLKFIDMATLSQSELRTFSFLANEHTPSLTPTIVASSAIDRSSFSESTISHRQVLSRLLPNHHHRHHRLAAPPHSENPNSLNSSSISPHFNPEANQDRIDCHAIVTSLKHLLNSNPEFKIPEPIDFPAPILPIGIPENYFEKPRKKRGRKPKSLVNSTGDSSFLVNKNNQIVNLDELRNLEDPFREELSRRTSGMSIEDDLVRFLEEMKGEWCNRRKIRKIVEAEEFGGSLPLGWKLLLGIKRQESLVWIYCRRYISPNGQFFLSCKEVAEHLHSLTLHRIKDTNFISLQPENLVEVEVRNIFDCFKCNISFVDKESYLKHLIAVHQSKKQRVSVSEGVIIREGKFECQFCHTVFEEKESYNSHVGVHIRSILRGREEVHLMETGTWDELGGNVGDEAYDIAIKDQILEGKSGRGVIPADDTLQLQQCEMGFLVGLNDEEVATLCVWCGLEFVHETGEEETLYDSLGYMCLTCKAKISGSVGSPNGV